METLKIKLISDFDGTQKEYEIVTDNRDRIRYELKRAREKWPQMADAPIIAQTYLAWAAMSRTGEISEMSFEKFQDTVTYTQSELTPVNPTVKATTSA